MKTLVVIPTYNEKGNIEHLITDLFNLGQNIDVLVVDDNSPDGTGQLMDQLVKKDPRIHVIHRPEKMGLGSAYIAGFKYAITKDFDNVFEMDADFSHDPLAVPRFLEKIADHDMVIGSRYLQGARVVNWPIKRLLLSYFANLYTRIITGLPLHDATGGFKCFRREVLTSLDLDAIYSDGYSFQIEVNYKCWKKKFKIAEIPIVFTDRFKGRSKMSKKIIREAVWMVWKLRLLSLFGKIK